MVGEVREGVLREETMQTVVRAARIFAAVTAESIAQAGDRVTLPQLRVLVLASTSSELNNNAVAEALGVHISNASRICDRLVQAQLLSRRDSPSDRRHVQLTLTPKGAALVAAVDDHRRAIFNRTLAGMDEGQQAGLAAALQRFIEVAEEQLQGLASYTP